MRKLALLALLLLAGTAQAIEVRAVRQQAPGTNTTQDYTVSGFGTVQAAIVVAGNAGSGSDVAPMRQSFGFWDTTNVVQWGNHYEDGAPIASAATRSGQSNSNVVEMLTGGVGTERSAAISAVTDGVRLTWAGSDTTVQPYVVVILINDINGAQAGADTPNATDGGTSSVTTTGLTPKVVFAGQNRGNIADGDVAWAAGSFGFAFDNGVSIEQYALGWLQVSGASQVVGRFSNTHVALNMGSSSTDTGQEVTAMASGSFTHTTRDIDGTGAADSDLYYLALDFSAEADTFNAQVPITTGDFVPYSGGSLTPSAVIALTSFHTALNATDGTNEAGFFGFYVATGSEEYQLGWAMEDGAATNSNTSGRTDTQMFIQDETAGTPDFLASSPSFTSGTITYADANVTEGSQDSDIAGVVFGAAAAAGTVNPLSGKFGKKLKGKLQ